MDALLGDVGAGDFRPSEPELEGRGLLPLVGEAVDLGQLGGVGTGGRQERERPSRVDRLELRPVTDQQHLRARLGRERCQPVKGEGAGERGLVNDDQLPLPELGPSSVVLVERLGGVLAADAQVLGEHLGGDSTGREADDAALAVGLDRKSVV